MKLKKASLFIVMFMIANILWAGKFELQISYGRWTLSPFTTLIERESEKMIKDELARLMSTTLPESFYTISYPQVDLSSSGYFLSFAVWYNFTNSHFSVGFRGQYYDFKLPFSTYSEQSIHILGYELARIETEGEGDVKLSSITASALGRWTFVFHPKLRLSLYGGLNIIPYEGDLFLDGQARVQTAFGDFEYQQKGNPTIDEIREWNYQVPSLLLSPEIGLSLQYEFLEKLGAMIDISLAQGASIAFGIFFSL